MFIPVSANVMVRPKDVCCVEQRVANGAVLTYVGLRSGKEYVLTVPIEQFLKSVDDAEPMIQQFAG